MLVVRQKARLLLEEEKERVLITFILLKATRIGERLQTSLVTCGSLSVLLVYGIIVMSWSQSCEK